MPKQNLQNKNSLNLFLNEYFNVFLLLIMIVIFAAAYFLLIGPKFKATVATINENIETQKKLYAEQEKKMKDLKTIQEVYEKISPADLKKFDSVLPNQYVKERLFGEFEEIVVQSGFLINSVSIASDEESAPKKGGTAKDMPTMGGVAGDKKIGELSISLSIGAIDYNGFKNMLKTLEANMRLFDIKSVTLGDGSAQIELVTYYYKPLQ